MFCFCFYKELKKKQESFTGGVAKEAEIKKKKVEKKNLEWEKDRDREIETCIEKVI